MELQEIWRSFYGVQVPIAYLLRPQKRDVWFRIHSSPESKRYPTDEGEMQEVLHRHNVVASEVLEENVACALFVPDYALEKLKPVFPEVLSATLFCHYENEDAEITQKALRVTWEPHQFDPILRYIANDEICYGSWMNLKSGEIFAPYDGGANLFLNSTQRRDELRTRNSAWLSCHPEGF